MAAPNMILVPKSSKYRMNFRLLCKFYFGVTYRKILRSINCGM